MILRVGDGWVTNVTRGFGMGPMPHMGWQRDKDENAEVFGCCDEGEDATRGCGIACSRGKGVTMHVTAEGADV